MPEVTSPQNSPVADHTPDVKIERRPDQVCRNGEMYKDDPDQNDRMGKEHGVLYENIKADQKKEQSKKDGPRVFPAIEIHEDDGEKYTKQGQELEHL
jgi:hypothetical protein